MSKIKKKKVKKGKNNKLHVCAFSSEKKNKTENVGKREKWVFEQKSMFLENS